jgi:hypothetical protein
VSKVWVLTICFIYGGTLNIQAQQNFFNVVSSDITAKNKLFFQQQINMTKEELQSNTTISKGFGHNFEIGLNLFAFNFNRAAKQSWEHQTNSAPYIHYMMINAQKRIDISRYIAVSFGFQQGFALASKIHFGGNYYCNFVTSSDDFGFKMVAGLYYATKSYFGYGKRLWGNSPGIELGVEKSIIKDKWYFQSDYISGRHSFGDLIVGTACFISKKWVLSGGYQIPNNFSKSQKAVVFEITFLPKQEGKNLKINLLK